MFDSDFDYVAYTDGSCPENPGYWGFAVIFINGKNIKHVITGGGKSGTNSIAELIAATEAISYIPEGKSIRIYCDSQYICNSLTKGWLKNWKSNGWKKPNGVIKNLDLWKEFDRLQENRVVDLVWVRGHNGNKFNELADQIAGEASERIKQGLKPVIKNYEW